MAMEWKVSEIKSRIREITGRPNTTQLSDADLLNYINNFWNYVLPLETMVLPLFTWFTFDTTEDQSSYTLSEDILTLMPPLTVDGTQITLHVDQNYFFQKYPQDQTYTSDKPLEALWYNNCLHFRPPPDAGGANQDGSYAIKIAGIKIDDAFTLDTHYPADRMLGNLIVYGTSIQIHRDNGEHEEADLLTGNPMVASPGTYSFYKMLAYKKRTLQLITTRARPAPSF